MSEVYPSLPLGTKKKTDLKRGREREMDKQEHKRQKPFSWGLLSTSHSFEVIEIQLFTLFVDPTSLV